jgi:hypothetical protein
MRIGIATGKCIVGPIGPSGSDLSGSGEAPILADRLQRAAQPNTIWICGKTRQLAGNRFDFEALEPVSVRGQTQRVQAYELIGVKARHNAFDGAGERKLTPLVGRESEWEQLQEAWGRTQRGQGHVVSLVGDAGLGKTRLLYEFKRAVDKSAGGKVYEGSCFDHDYGGNPLFLPFREVVKSLFSLDDGSKQVADLLGEGARQIELDPAALPALRHLLSQTAGEFAGLPSVVIRKRTVEALCELVAAVARRHPLALIVEDFHWTDEPTKEVVEKLVADAANLRLMLVLAFRPPEDPPRGALNQQWVQRVLNRPHSTRLDLHSIG